MNKTCPSCYQSNPPEAVFCLSCAAPLPKPQQYGGSWQANQPNYGAQPAGRNFMNPVGYTAEASSRAKLACALGVLGIFCLSVFASIPAIFIGWSELSSIKHGQSSPGGKAMASFGMWSGIVTTILHIGLVFLAFIMALMDAASSPDYY